MIRTRLMPIALASLAAFAAPSAASAEGYFSFSIGPAYPAYEPAYPYYYSPGYYDDESAAWLAHERWERAEARRRYWDHERWEHRHWRHHEDDDDDD